MVERFSKLKQGFRSVRGPRLSSGVIGGVGKRF